MKTLLNHCHLIVDGNKEFLDGAVLINGEYIEDVFPHTNKLGINNKEYEKIDMHGLIIMPGFFDTHMHGSIGYDFRDENKFNLNEVANSLVKHGTTSFFATVNGYKDELNILEKLNDLNTTSAKCLGVHLEGPFVSKEKLGVGIKENVLEPDVEYVKELIKLNPHIKQMTIAPELNGSKDVIKVLKENNIKVMFGHSNAKANDVEDISYDGFTHFYNAMSGFNHHDLGLVNVGYNNSDKYIELIGDGIHVDESVLKITLKNFRIDRIILISDAISSAGLPDGNYSYNNKPCIKQGNKFYRVEDGKLSGSCNFLIDEVKLMKKLGVSYTDILLMSSLNAYRLYGLDKLYGSLQKGKYADLVVLDDECNLKEVYVKGEKYA